MSEKNIDTEEYPNEGGISQVYELGYLMLPTISEEELPVEVGKIKSIVDAVAPITISEEYPKMTPLAYSMRKRFEDGYKIFSSGYFGWIKFEGASDSILAIKKELDTQKLVLRYIIIHTTRENTMRQKSFQRPRRPEKENEKEEKEELDVEAVDKEIASLIS